MIPQVRQEPLRPALKLVTPAGRNAGGTPEPTPARQLTVALVGQPNVGKSTVFNMLTGLNQHVGNWPGKTVEQKIGAYRHNGTLLNLVDLPGTYSLTANSEEERIARDYLVRERPDVVIAVVNAAALERSLYLVAELLSLSQPLVLGLNMSDVAEQHGIRVESHVLAAALGVPVIPLIATKNAGVRELVDAALKVTADPASWQPNRPAIRADHRPVLESLCALITGHVPAPYPEDWVALKLLEGDAEITALVRQALPAPTWGRVHALLMQHEDAYLDIAGGRYEWIGRMVRAAVTQPRAGAITRTERIDRVATHPVWGLLLLLAMFGLIFWLTYAVATPIAGWLSRWVLGGLDALAAVVLRDAPPWLFGLVSDGLIHGVGTVFTFLPILIIFFAALGTLEDVGYLARGAYVMDRFMHLMGLHGKSFMPLFLGFGCNVPAVLGARILEDRRARLLTILLAPLVPCTARLAVIAFLTPAFFPHHAALVSWGLVALSLAVLAVAGIVVNRLAFQGEHTAFIMELPLYHVPNPRTVGLYVKNNTVSFVKKAGTLILIASMAVWALSTLPGRGIEQSFLAYFGRALEPVGALMGLGNWRVIVALLTSFFAKENTIATLGVLYGSGQETGALAAQVALALTAPARLAFLVVQMLFIPCLATVATIKQETGSWRWTWASIGMMLGLSFGVGVVVYQIVRML
jgi:ferrous iron transport protein B